MLFPRASDLEEEPTIDLNKVLEYARNMSNLCWQFAQVDFPTVLAMCYSLLPFMHSQMCFCVHYRCTI